MLESGDTTVRCGWGRNRWIWKKKLDADGEGTDGFGRKCWLWIIKEDFERIDYLERSSIFTKKIILVFKRKSVHREWFLGCAYQDK